MFLPMEGGVYKNQFKKTDLKQIHLRKTSTIT